MKLNKEKETILIDSLSDDFSLQLMKKDAAPPISLGFSR